MRRNLVPNRKRKRNQSYERPQSSTQHHQHHNRWSGDHRGRVTGVHFKPRGPPPVNYMDQYEARVDVKFVPFFEITKVLLDFFSMEKTMFCEVIYYIKIIIFEYQPLE